MIIDFEEIDWAKLWKCKNAISGSQCINNMDWDNRADNFSKQYINQDYISQVIQKMDISSNDTVLDLGCGPGTLAIPLAKRAKKITAVDFSERMLEIVSKRARKNKLDNINIVKKDFGKIEFEKEISQHDVIICSRSFPDQYPKENLLKLNNLALKAVFLTIWINGADEYEFFIRKAYNAAGYDYFPRPDYIYILNILYSIGIQANVDFVEYQDILEYKNMNDLMDKLFWKLKKTNIKKRKKLRSYLTSIINCQDDSVINLKFNCRWALINWKI